MTLQARLRAGRVAVTRPNWNQPVSVEYSFATSIFSSYEEHEQREALRVTPRIEVSYTSILTPPMYHRWLADMQTPNEPLVVTAEWSKTTLATSAAGGDTVLQLSEAPAWLVEGVYLVLVSKTLEEAVLVSGVAGTTVTLDTATTLSFVAGDKVYLGLLAHSDAETQFRAESDKVLVGVVRYTGVPGSCPVGVGGTVGALFESKEIMPFEPNWKSRPQIVPTALRDTFDPGRGRLLHTATTNRLKRVDKYGFTGRSSDQITELVGFFLRRKGQRGSFWMPSFMYDLDVTAATGSQLTVPGTDFHTAFTGSDTNNCIALRHPTTGDWVARRITSLTISAGNTLVNTAAWGFTPAVGAKVSWLQLARFATDRLEVRHLTSEVAEVEFAIETLRNP